MHSLSLLMSTEHVRDLQRQAASGRLARAARRSAPAEEDFVPGSSLSKRSFRPRLMSLVWSRHYPEEA